MYKSMLYCICMLFFNYISMVKVINSFQLFISADLFGVEFYIANMFAQVNWFFMLDKIDELLQLT